jgi:hypothetical protein
MVIGFDGNGVAVTTEDGRSFEEMCAAVTNWATERRRDAGAGGVKTVQWLG